MTNSIRLFFLFIFFFKAITIPTMLITYSSVLLTVFLIGIQLNEFVEGHEEGTVV